MRAVGAVFRPNAKVPFTFSAGEINFVAFTNRQNTVPPATLNQALQYDTVSKMKHQQTRVDGVVLMEKEIQKAKKNILITFAIFAVIFALIVSWGLYYAYWHNFSTSKWIYYPERRAKMAADLFDRYDLVGMSKEQMEELLGDAKQPLYFRALKW